MGFQRSFAMLAVFALSVVFTTSATSAASLYLDERAPLDKRVDDLVARMTLDEKLEMLGGTGFGTKANARLGIPEIRMTDGPQGVRGPYATAFPSMLSMVATWNPEIMRKVSAAIGREVRATGKNMILGPCVTLYRVPYSGRNFECFGEDPHLNAKLAASYVHGTQDAGVLSSTKHFVLNNQELNRMSIDMTIDERSLHELELPAFVAAIQAGTDSVMCSYNKINGVYACENEPFIHRLLKGELGFQGFVISDWGATHSDASVSAGLDLEMPFGNHMNPALKDSVEKGRFAKSLIDDKIRRLVRSMMKAGLKFGVPQAAEPPTRDLSTPRNRAVALEAAREAIVLLKNERAALPLRSLKSLAVIGPGAVHRRIHGGGSGEVNPSANSTALAGLEASLGTATKIRYLHGMNIPGQPERLEARDVATRLPDGTWARGFLTECFDNRELKGKPVVTRIDPTIAVWDSPDKRLKAQQFSCRFSGTIKIEKKRELIFDTWTAGRSYRFFLDGKLVKDTFDDEQIWETTIQAGEVQAGYHHIRFEYKARHDFYGVSLGWFPPPSDRGEAVELARASDAAVVFVGTSGAFEWEHGDRPNLSLAGDQAEVIRAVAKANPRTIVVVHSGGPIDVSSWRDEVAAIVYMGFAGQEGGRAVAEALSGSVNPSGKLPYTLPLREADSPSSAYYPGDGVTMDYGKVGIFEGYRGYDARKVEPAFAFGHGLSYSTFAYAGASLTLEKAEASAPKATVKVTLKNTSRVAGAEVVQLYVHARNAKIARAPRELKAFAKAHLRAGESRELSFALDAEAFRYWDTASRSWKVDPGSFEIHVGSSSRDIRHVLPLALK